MSDKFLARFEIGRRQRIPSGRPVGRPKMERCECGLRLDEFGQKYPSRGCARCRQLQAQLYAGEFRGRERREQEPPAYKLILGYFIAH